MTAKSLEDAFVDELKDLLSAEKQLTKALPKMAKSASHPELKAVLEEHLKQTEEQVHRIERVFESINRSPRAKKSEVVEELINKGKDILKKDGAPNVRDALLIAAEQKVEHHEIACYGTLCTWAEMLGYDEACELLKQNLAEEKEADEKLSRIAQETVNKDAMVGAH
jgi:ferritin-like metal-binding protein YciE